MKKADVVFLTLTIALFSLMAMPLFYGVVYAKSSNGDSNSNSNGGDSSSSSSTSNTKSKSDDGSTSEVKLVTGGMGMPGGLADGNPPVVGSDTGSDTGDTGNQLPQPQPPDNTIGCKQVGNPACDGPVGGSNFLSSPSPSPEPTPTPAAQPLPVLGPDQSCKTDPSQDKCARTGPDCPSGFFNNEEDHCVPSGPCPKGTFVEDNDETGRCQPIKHKEPGNGGHNGGSDHHDTKVVVRTKVVVETKVKTAIINQFPKVFNAPLLTHQPAVLLLLDSGQICAEARDLECATTQNLFKIFNVITKFDGSAWHISG